LFHVSPWIGPSPQDFYGFFGHAGLFNEDFLFLWIFFAQPTWIKAKPCRRQIDHFANIWRHHKGVTTYWHKTL